MNLPLVSIITPTLNRAEMLAQSMASVLAQNYYDFEHIIVDGGSTDGTLEMLAKYPYLHVISGKDRGMYDAINRGLEIARGEIICFLNSDDLLPPKVLPIIVRTLESQPSTDAVVGKAMVFFHTPDKPETVLSLDFQKPLLPQLVKGGVLIFNAWFFRRRVFEKIGLLDPRYKIAGDMEFLIRFIMKGLTVTELPDILYYYRRHIGSITFSEKRDKVFAPGDEHLQLINNYFAEKKIPPQNQPLFRECAIEQSAMLSIESLIQRKIYFFHYIVIGLSYELLFPVRVFIKVFMKSLKIILNKFTLRKY